MSTHTVSVGRSRPPAFAAITALAAVLVIAALAFAAMTFDAGSFSGTRSSVEVPAPSADDMPTPEWLESYLEPRGAVSIPTPEWLEGYLELEAPVTG